MLSVNVAGLGDWGKSKRVDFKKSSAACGFPMKMAVKWS